MEDLLPDTRTLLADYYRQGHLGAPPPSMNDKHPCDRARSICCYTAWRHGRDHAQKFDLERLAQFFVDIPAELPDNGSAGVIENFFGTPFQVCWNGATFELNPMNFNLEPK